MPHPIRFRFALATLALAWGIGFATDARGDRAQGSIEVSFIATSTLHDFEGAAVPLPISIETQPDGSWSTDVLVPVADLDTGIGRRDQSLRSMLDADHHPEIRGRFRGIDPEQLRRSSVLPFLLRIREVERPVRATLSHWHQEERRVRLDAEFDVSLADFSLEAPRVLFVSVGDVVHVSVHVTLERS